MQFAMRTITIAFFCFLAIGSLAEAKNIDELRQMIDAKNQELQSINNKIEETQRALDEAQSKGKTLKQEVSKLTNTIGQLNLLIRSSEVTIRKLELELETLEYDVEDVKATIIKNRGAIGEILRRIQQKDNEHFLALLLRNKSLAEGVLEMQNLVDLNNNLSVQIDHLRSLEAQLSEKIDEASKKQQNLQQESQNLKSRKSIVEDEQKAKDQLLRATKNREAIYAQQLEELEEQQAEISDAIDQIEDELRRSFDPSILPLKRSGVFMWPVKLAKDGGNGRITQHYGEVSRLYRGKPHNGLDIGVPVGTPVYAADDGEVIAVDNNDRSSWRKYQYGKYVLIQHDNNLATLYAHLSRQVVQKGDTVRRGDVIGYSGNTGYSTGAHLHFGAYWAPSISLKEVPPAAGLVPIGVTIAPEDYL